MNLFGELRNSLKWQWGEVVQGNKKMRTEILTITNLDSSYRFEVKTWELHLSSPLGHFLVWYSNIGLILINFSNNLTIRIIMKLFFRHAFTHPGFACQQQLLMSGYNPQLNDDYYYSKFKCTGKHMKKLQRGCSWRCTALVLVAVCVILLACTMYFAGE